MSLTQAWVLGGSGFIGKAIIQSLKALTPSVETRSYSSSELPLGSACTKVEIPHSGLALIACAGLRKEQGDSKELFWGNLEIAKGLCEISSQTLPRLVFLSSVAVYGGHDAQAEISENSPTLPLSWYGLSKLVSEQILTRAYSPCPERLLILRLPSVFGPGECQRAYNPGWFLRDCLNGTPVTLRGDGKEQREFIWVEDIGTIVSQLLDSKASGVVNVVSGISTSFAEALKLAQGLSAGAPPPRTEPRLGPKVDQRFDPSRLRSLFPDFQFTPLASGLKRLQKEELTR